MKKYEKIKFKILLPGTIAFIVIISFFIIEILNFQEENFTHENNEKVNSVKRIFEHIISDEVNILKSNILFLAKDKKLQNLFLKKDKKNLIKYGNSIYKELKDEFKITLFYFIDTNDNVFLRMHNKKRFGNKIDNFIYKKAKENKKIFYGMELGHYGIFAIRLVMPLILDNKVIGYLGLGKKLDNLTKTLKELTNFDFIFMIDKNFLEKEKWEESIRILNNENNYKWDDFKNFVVVENTLKNFNEIKNFLKIKNEKFLKINKEKFFLYKSIDLLDVKKQNVGKIIFIHNITKQKTYTENLIKKQIIVSLSILFILFILFYFYFSKIENFIKKSKEKLFSEIEKRKKSEIIAKEGKKTLEIILNGIPDVIYITDKNYKIKFANSKMKKRYGKNIIGKKCYKVRNNNNKICSWCIFDNLKKEKIINYELEKDNKYFFVRNIIINDFEKLTIFNDITKIKEKEIKLREINEEYITINEEYKAQNEELFLSKEKIRINEKLLLRIIENYPNSFISIIDKNMDIKFISGQEFKNIKRNINYFLNLNLNEILFRKNFSFIKKNLLKTFDGKEKKFIVKTKNNLFYSYKTIPLENNNRIITNILVIIENVTREKENQLKIISTNDELKLKNKNIISSINYAKYIQHAMLPKYHYLKQFLPENFVVYLPKDIISGDFYWVKQFNDNILIALADCTGHGVPGAFMSILGITSLNEIISDFGWKGEIKANEVLNKLREKIKKILFQGEAISKRNNNGMDIAFCVFNLTNKKLQYAGANIPLILMRKNNNKKYEIQDFKADRIPIGNYIKEKDFKNNEIQLYENDMIYMFSDGFQDQFGGEKGRKFMRKNFKDFLLKNCEKELSEQKEIIKNTFYEWKKDNKQVDDVSVMGFKIFESYGDVEFF